MKTTVEVTRSLTNGAARAVAEGDEDVTVRWHSLANLFASEHALGSRPGRFRLTAVPAT